jgi:hypothetical protein
MAKLQSLALAVLGAWIMATLCMWFTATRSFTTVESVLNHPAPAFEEITKPLEKDSVRTVLRFLASEINRSLFWGYGALQIVLGAILLFLVWRQTPRSHLDAGVVIAMLALAVILTLIITPMLVHIGRSIDFVPRNPPPPSMSRFWALHGSFTGLDAVKLFTAIGLLIRWVVR